MNIPTLLITFNRPRITQKLLDNLRLIKPEKLYVFADGPRQDNKTDEELCVQTRELIKTIDWDCDIQTFFQEKNLGCKQGVAAAINWFFENIEEGIILEDDCVPNNSFFYFCEKNLEKYRENEKIMHISGSNLQFGEKFGEASYYFSYCPHVWGWATWKRAWNKYDLEMTDLDNFIKTDRAYVLFKNKKLSSYWNSLFRYAKDKNINTWDIQWNYSLLKYGGLSITPNLNLVENIGFSFDATHTTEGNSKFEQKTQELNEVVHPIEIYPDLRADYQTYKKVYFRSIFDKIKSKVKLFLKSLYEL